MDSRAQLKRLIFQRSYREGDFTLASGRKSSFYIDLKATTLHPEGARLIGECACDLLAHNRVDAVGGLTLGADPIATSVSLAAWRRGLHWPAFIVRKEPKKHGTSKYIEGTENLKPGAHVVVLEDVVTTGGSSMFAIERLRAEGYHVLGVLTALDREEGGREFLEARGLWLRAITSLGEIRKLAQPSASVE
jgi:orotate phosphoribosyltransferase